VRGGDGPPDDGDGDGAGPGPGSWDWDAFDGARAGWGRTSRRPRAGV
jgi:hypothetical protein